MIGKCVCGEGIKNSFRRRSEIRKDIKEFHKGIELLRNSRSFVMAEG